MEHIIDADASVVCLSETWLKSNKNDITATVKSYNYEMFHNIRKNRAKDTGGGVGIIFKNDLNVKQIKVKQFQTFEHSIVKVKLDQSWLIVISIYRLDYEPIALFFDEFTELLEIFAAVDDKLVIAGDINIHCDKIEDCNTIRLNDLLSAFNLIQIIDKPTHRAGHTLDVVITQEDIRITNVEVSDVALSDHFLLSFIVDCKASLSFRKKITFRNIKKVNSDTFRSDLEDSLKNICIDEDLEKVMNNYNTELSKVMDNHAPMLTKEVKIVSSAPWFDAEYRELRKQRRRAEKKYKQTQNPEDKEVFKRLRKETTTLALQKKQLHFTSIINEASNKQKKLFAVVNTLIDNKQGTCLPTASSDIELADQFQKYFKDKIQKIRETFEKSEEFMAGPPLELPTLSTFEPTTEEELRTIIVTHGIGCSPMDPVHAKLLAQNTDLMLPVWVDIVNLSLSTGSMDCLKSAVVIPLLKELDESVDTEIYKNYRPVSNLVFLSKLIERCVDVRLEKHMVDNNLESIHQHGYKKGHSTEMLLTKVVDDVLTGFDNKLATVLLFLDLSAAFDTVDQDKLLGILYNEIGVSGIAYKWFVSFLKGRSQQVKINDSYSDPESLDYGVAQGSVLGPKLFRIYVRSFYPHVQVTSFEVEGFADDHQVYKQFIISCQTNVLGYGINECLHDILTWMNKFCLRLNKSKTKILVFAPPSIQSLIHIHGTFLKEGCIRFTSCAKNLGVWLDENLNFKYQINKVASSCFNVLRQISKIKRFIPEDSLRTLIAALVFSKLDYCNALYNGIGSNEISKLQAVQNAAVRLVSGGYKYDRKPISHRFNELHWLKIRERIVFKVCLLVHKCLWTVAPQSLKCMLVISNTRTYYLAEKKFNMVHGERAFSRSGPKLWNNLPLNIRQEKQTVRFKKLLKSYLMTESHNFYRRVNMR